MKHLINFNKFLINEAVITQSDIPNTMTFWHGGNLEIEKSSVAHKSGRYVYGAGLYLTTKYLTAKEYSKGSRRLYKVVVEKGLDIDDSLIDLDKAIEFVKNYVKFDKRKELINIFIQKEENGKIPGYYFNNNILNQEAISASKTAILREFIVSCGIDYELDSRGELMVLYNMNKIVETVRVMPTDEILTFDFKNSFV